VAPSPQLCKRRADSAASATGTSTSGLTTPAAGQVISVTSRCTGKWLLRKMINGQGNLYHQG